MVYQQCFFFFCQDNFLLASWENAMAQLGGGGGETHTRLFQSLGFHKSYFHRLPHKMYLGLAETYAHPNLQNVILNKGRKRAHENSDLSSLPLWAALRIRGLVGWEANFASKSFLNGLLKVFNNLIFPRPILFLQWCRERTVSEALFLPSQSGLPLGPSSHLSPFSPENKCPIYPVSGP